MNTSLPTPSRDISTPQTLMLICLAGMLTIILSTVPVLSLLNYPFRLLLTIVHELGHGTAALLTGGSFVRFVVYADGSGLAYTIGGWRSLVIPAGYLGTAMFGALLIMLGRDLRDSRIAMGFIGLVMLMMSLCYGAPSIFDDPFAGLLTTVSGVGFGAIFVGIALRGSPSAVIFILHFIAIQAALTAFSDLMYLIGLSTQGYVTQNDALSMAELTGIPAVIWAIFWAMMATGLLFGAIWITWGRRR